MFLFGFRYFSEFLTRPTDPCTGVAAKLLVLLYEGLAEESLLPKLVADGREIPFKLFRAPVEYRRAARLLQF